MSFPRKFGDECGQEILDTATKTETNTETETSFSKYYIQNDEMKDYN